MVKQLSGEMTGASQMQQLKRGFTIGMVIFLVSVFYWLYPACNMTDIVSLQTQPLRSLEKQEEIPIQKPRTNKGAFNNIYENNLWDSTGKYPSGFGSIPENNLRYLLILQHLVNYEEIHRIVEVGFGDFNIFGRIRLPKNTTYIGYDVADSLLRLDRQNEFFKIVNSIEDIRYVKGDLLISKDVIQHLPNQQVQFFFKNILPNFKYAFITNDYSNYTSRTDVLFGEHAPINPAVETNLPHEEVYYQSYGGDKRGFIFPKKPW